jgi:hypothetical protein
MLLGTWVVSNEEFDVRVVSAETSVNTASVYMCPTCNSNIFVHFKEAIRIFTIANGWENKENQHRGFKISVLHSIGVSSHRPHQYKPLTTHPSWAIAQLHSKECNPIYVEQR